MVFLKNKEKYEDNNSSIEKFSKKRGYKNART